MLSRALSTEVHLTSTIFGGAISFILMTATILLTVAAHLIVQRRYR
jgi:hypothetical protein